MPFNFAWVPRLTLLPCTACGNPADHNDVHDSLEAIGMIRAVHPQTVGIAAIGIYEPPWMLGNDWFSDILPRKFVQHTGILSRHISLEDEVVIGIRAVEKLQRETNCDMQDCAAMVFVSPSVVHASVGREYLDQQHAWLRSTNRAAQEVVRRLGIPAVQVYGINWGCSGYSKAISIVHRHILPSMRLGPNQFVMVATASRISRITDYGCKKTAPLFGDLGTATILSPSDSEKYPVHFDLVFAGAEMQTAEGVFFDYHLQENVIEPTPEGGRSFASRRLVFSLDGLGIADAAPRAMADVTAKALRDTRIRPEEVRFLVPHQAGTGIVRLAAMKLEEIGVRGEVINGLTCDVGNVSSCSVPYALRKTWDQLQGIVACPTAGVGHPGHAEVSQGCVILQATEIHS
jgi:3-oxoacyl-[acyl-carrier-protein] synthase III